MGIVTISLMVIFKPIIMKNDLFFQNQSELGLALIHCISSSFHAIDTWNTYSSSDSRSLNYICHMVSQYFLVKSHTNQLIKETRFRVDTLISFMEKGNRMRYIIRNIDRVNSFLRWTINVQTSHRSQQRCTSLTVHGQDICRNVQVQLLQASQGYTATEGEGHRMLSVYLKTNILRLETRFYSKSILFQSQCSFSSSLQIYSPQKKTLSLHQKD